MADWIEELKRLSSLREQGILSDDEFEELKRGLLPNAPDEPEVEVVEAAVDPEVEELRRLSSLHESGILSDSEFAAEKARILGLSTVIEEEQELELEEEDLELESKEKFSEPVQEEPEEELSEPVHEEPEEAELELEPDSEREKDSRPDAIQVDLEEEIVAGGKGRKSLAVLLLLAGIGVGGFFLFSGGGEDTGDETAVEESTEAADGEPSVSTEEADGAGSGSNQEDSDSQIEDGGSAASDSQDSGGEKPVSEGVEDDLDDEVDEVVDYILPEPFLAKTFCDIGEISIIGRAYIATLSSLPYWISIAEGFFDDANIEIECAYFQPGLTSGGYGEDSLGYFENILYPNSYLRLRSGLLDFVFDNMLCDSQITHLSLPRLCESHEPIRHILDSPDYEIVVNSKFSLASVATVEEFLAIIGCSRVGGVRSDALDTLIGSAGLDPECFTYSRPPRFGETTFVNNSSGLPVDWAIMNLRDSIYYQKKDLVFPLKDVEVPVEIINFPFWGQLGASTPPSLLRTPQNDEGYISYKANKDFLSNNPEWVCAFNSAMNKAVRFIKDPANDQRTIVIAAEILSYDEVLYGDSNLEAEIIRAQLDQYRDLFLETKIDCASAEEPE